MPWLQDVSKEFAKLFLDKRAKKLGKSVHLQSGFFDGIFFRNMRGGNLPTPSDPLNKQPF